jgi:predicted DNA-binding ribbon-helix-helix protein
VTNQPSTTINPLEACTRAQNARHIIDGFSTVFPTLASFWRQIDDALSDTPALTAEIANLRAQLATSRLDRANLAAAGRATITAYLNGESDPLAYLRDELHAQGFATGRGTYE